MEEHFAQTFRIAKKALPFMLNEPFGNLYRLDSNLFRISIKKSHKIGTFFADWLFKPPNFPRRALQTLFAHIDRVNDLPPVFSWVV